MRGPRSDERGYADFLGLFELLIIRILFSQHNFEAGRQDRALKHLAERDDYYGGGSGKVVLTLRVRFRCGVAAPGPFAAKLFLLQLSSLP